MGTPVRPRTEFEAFIRQGVRFGARLALSTPIRGSHGNAAAMAFTVTYHDGKNLIATNSLDVMHFDDAGKIVEMKGYWGPEDASVVEPR